MKKNCLLLTYMKNLARPLVVQYISYSVCSYVSYVVLLFRDKLYIFCLN